MYKIEREIEMQFKQWEEIPEFMQNEEVKLYYDILSKKRYQLKVKRFFDILISLTLIILLSPVFLIVSFWIKLDSEGPIFYKQERVTQYGRKFYIIKFRTMVVNADQMGTLITTAHDSRITKAGEKIRKLRIDEIPQLFNIMIGDMSFVGTRPEVPQYVMAYTDEMKATLLLPAGVTSETSILYRDEDKLLKNVENVDEIYVREILPVKMKMNLNSIKKLSVLYELDIIVKTVFAVLVIN